MKGSVKKLTGLRRYHLSRPVKTRLKLLEALDRMESGQTVIVGPWLSVEQDHAGARGRRQYQHPCPEAAGW